MFFIGLMCGIIIGFIAGILFTRRNIKKVNDAIERCKQEQQEFKRRIG